MSKKRSIAFILGLLITIMLLAACGNDTPAEVVAPTPAPTVEATPQPTPEPTPESEQTPEEPPEPTTIYDREGFEVILPDSIETIVSIAPSNSEILIALGLGDLIIAADNNFVVGLNQDVKVLDMFGLDLEHIISLNPDLIVASSMIMFAGDPLEPARDLGIAVAYIPTSDSIEGVKEDIRFLAEVFEVEARGEAVIAEMEAEIAEIQAIVAGVTERRTVYFEISAAPFTFGGGTFLNELVEIAGGINIFADQDAWFSPSAEDVLTLDPDLILTSTNYIDDPIGELLSRDGWGVLTAIQNENVHIIDTDASNRPSQNMVLAIRQIAEAVYPEYFE